MALFMDISRDDKGEVNSVLIGCDCSPSARAVFIYIKEAQAWGRWHSADVHPKQPSGVTQIGCVLSETKAKQNARRNAPKERTYTYFPRPKKRQDQLFNLLIAEGERTSQQIAEFMDKPIKQATNTMKKMRERGVVTSRKVGRVLYWTAVTDTQDLLEAS